MLKVTEYEKDCVKWLKFTWCTGSLNIMEDKWNKLSKKDKDKILKLAE